MTSHHNFSKLSAFSLGSFELDAVSGGSHRYADAVSGVEDAISLSPQAMGLIGNATPAVSLPTSSESPS